MDALTTQFARTLGLLPGLSPPTTQLPTYNTLVEVTDLAHGWTTTESGEFYARTSAEYLPSILKIISETTARPDTMENALRLAAYTAVMPVSAYNRRFVREQGDEAFAYFLALLRIIYELPSKLSQSGNEKEEEDARWILRTLFRELHERFNDLLVAYPGSSFPLSPALNEQQHLALRRLVQAIRSDPTLDLDLDEDEKRLLLALLDALPRLETLDLFAMRKERALRLIGVWDFCEWLRTESRAEGDVTCVELKDGEELQACSRCLTVRYCSKEHQKLHWKQHKYKCFKSSW